MNVEFLDSILVALIVLALLLSLPSLSRAYRRQLKACFRTKDDKEAGE